MASSRTALSCPGCTARIFNATLDLYAGKKGLSSRLQQYPSVPRTFSTTRARRAQGAMPTQRRPAMPSFKVAMAAEQEAAIKKGLIPRGGVAVVKDVVIIPSWKSLIMRRGSSIDVKSTLRAGAVYVKSWAKTYGTYWYTWLQLRKHKPAISFDRKKAASIAERLHQRVFQAFAAGTLSAEQEVVCDGLYNKLQKRLSQRRPGETLDWQISKVVEKPKLVAYVAMPLQTDLDSSKPITGENVQLQAVVRLHTQQSLQRVINRTTKQGGRKAETTTTKVPLDAQPVIKETVEYAVINKTITDGVASDWMLWGFTQESNIKEIFAAKEIEDKQHVQDVLQEYKKRPGTP